MRTDSYLKLILKTLSILFMIKNNMVVINLVFLLKNQTAIRIILFKSDHKKRNEI